MGSLFQGITFFKYKVLDGVTFIHFMASESTVMSLVLFLKFMFYVCVFPLRLVRSLSVLFIYKFYFEEQNYDTWLSTTVTKYLRQAPLKSKH